MLCTKHIFNIIAQIHYHIYLEGQSYKSVKKLVSQRNSKWNTTVFGLQRAKWVYANDGRLMSPWPCPPDNRVRDFNGLANPLPCLSARGYTFTGCTEVRIDA